MENLIITQNAIITPVAAKFIGELQEDQNGFLTDYAEAMRQVLAGLVIYMEKGTPSEPALKNIKQSIPLVSDFSFAVMNLQKPYK